LSRKHALEEKGAAAEMGAFRCEGHGGRRIGAQGVAESDGGGLGAVFPDAGGGECADVESLRCADGRETGERHFGEGMPRGEP